MTAPGLRGRKKAETRRRLAAAAVDLFSERGFDAVTMQDVAAAADVGSRTVFRYFVDKAELVFADEAVVDEELRQVLRTEPAQVDAWSAVEAALVELTDLWADQRREGVRRRRLVAGSAALTARHLVKLDRRAEVIAEELVARGAAREAARVIGRCATAAFDCAVDRWLDDPQVSLAEALQDALDVLRH
ncbi:TetR family transcriptional regulator [Nocardioides sp. zg-1308]|uniref:TetR family transcriptional regulator n=1 Tax=Nocardioides sp. zg-1308 TaxID=2736253 RepID=UPI0015566942|nr:TetR family transcriptional regulator [Nocardioides sp. zg-1308]